MQLCAPVAPNAFSTHHRCMRACRRRHVEPQARSWPTIPPPFRCNRSIGNSFQLFQLPPIQNLLPWQHFLLPCSRFSQEMSSWGQMSMFPITSPSFPRKLGSPYHHRCSHLCFLPSLHPTVELPVAEGGIRTT